jgi:hypothetical protein
MAKRRSKEYECWRRIKQRCHNPKDKDYPAYGGRGIRVCDAWRASFREFLAAVGPAPSPRHSLDRIDNDRGYEPGNVRWALPVEQANNRRNTRRYTFGGSSVPQSLLAARHDISPQLLYKRVKKLGWSVERAVSTKAGEAPRTGVPEPAAG